MVGKAKVVNSVGYRIMVGDLVDALAAGNIFATGLAYLTVIFTSRVFPYKSGGI